MDEKTLVALCGSIDVKWKGIRYRGGEDRGFTNCPLCHPFVVNHCKGCPVYEVTGETGCDGSPYPAWVNHHLYDHEGSDHWIIHPGCKECEELCDEEIAFLESLLPEGANPNG